MVLYENDKRMASWPMTFSEMEFTVTYKESHRQMKKLMTESDWILILG